MIDTKRLLLREFTYSDSTFVIELLNDPAWIKNIGDKHVRTVADANTYLKNGPIASYRNNGFGLFAFELKSEGVIVGTCGLINRPGPDDVDVGFAFLPQFRGKGYALEASIAVLDAARSVHHLRRVLAIVLPENTASIRLVEKLGMVFDKEVVLPDDPTPLACYYVEL